MAIAVDKDGNPISSGSLFEDSLITQTDRQEYIDKKGWTIEYIWATFGSNGWKNTGDNKGDIAEKRMRYNRNRFIDYMIIVDKYGLKISPFDISEVVSITTPYEPNGSSNWMGSIINAVVPVVIVIAGIVSAGSAWGVAGALLSGVGSVANAILANQTNANVTRINKEAEHYAKEAHKLREKDPSKEFDRQSALTNVLMVNPLAIMANGALYNKGRVGSDSFEPTTPYEPYKYLMMENIKTNPIDEALMDRKHYEFAGNKDYYDEIYPQAKWQIINEDTTTPTIVQKNISRIIKGYSKLGEMGWADESKAPSFIKKTQKFNESLAKLEAQLKGEKNYGKVLSIINGIFDSYYVKTYKDPSASNPVLIYLPEAEAKRDKILNLLGEEEALLLEAYNQLCRYLQDNFVKNYNPVNLNDWAQKEIFEITKMFLPKNAYSGWN
ncbi:hypothetical protein [Helicobacter sp. 11S02596-1]|uniref:hypothetical protein n=1 Tax=Helicobacter sp. 11S02596-1 TaxID=1476194 RepID=UPI000BA5A1E9|nr:hypothetical protein [Helicobacter sp. 11S02596-1]PAF41199.1 hypothetical protein BJI48_08950 [Helicobacter sp. 11S02596-1]